MSRPDSTKEFTRTLTSSTRGIRFDDCEIEGRQVTPSCADPWVVRASTLRGGKQEGVEIVTIDNGLLELRVIPTRGMGILDVRMGDLELRWDSPVREVVHPALINLQGRGGLGWLEGFNEWMVRCGLESAGHPGKDRFVNNVGEEAEMDLTLHGKVANIPASEVELRVSDAAPYTLRLRGRVDERMLFGPKLELWSELSVNPGAAEFAVRDAVTNRGAGEQEFQLLYHVNFGAPLLEEGSRFVGAVERIFPLNRRAAEGLAAFDRYSGPEPGFVEQVYCITPFADPGGETAMLLRNRAGDRGCLLEFSVRELPCFTLWKNLSAPEEGYVTGFEPGTGYPFARRIERSFGRVPRLAPGETRTFTTRYRLLEGREDVEHALARIEAVRAGRATERISNPPILP